VGNYVIHDKCKCFCSVYAHRQIIVESDGLTEVIRGSCKTQACFCEEFKPQTCCGHCSHCNWGGTGQPLPIGDGRSDAQLYQYACNSGRDSVAQNYAENARKEILRRGLPDPWTPGGTSGSFGRNRW
jgi:hypothetical protein